MLSIEVLTDVHWKEGLLRGLSWVKWSLAGDSFRGQARLEQVGGARD